MRAGRDLTQVFEEISIRVRSKGRERLDLYLLRRLGWTSRSRVQRLVRLGRVAVNGSVARPATRLSAGDQIRVTLRSGGEAVRDGDPALSPPFWEDPYLLAVDKPAGRVVHPVGSTVSGTVIHELHHRFRSLNERGRRLVVPKLCHRLDRETSGVLLVAKTDAARRAVQRSFENDEVEKTYLAVVEGSPSGCSFRVETPIAPPLSGHGRAGGRLARAHPEGKPACTEFTVLHRGKGFALLRCRPLTGRQNQIRVHLAGLGHPILGDLGYGSGPAGRWEEMWSDASAEGPPPFPGRSLLHSLRLALPHPVWRTRVSLALSPAPDFAPFLPANAEEARVGGD